MQSPGCSGKWLLCATLLGATYHLYFIAVVIPGVLHGLGTHRNWVQRCVPVNGVFIFMFVHAFIHFHVAAWRLGTLGSMFWLWTSYFLTLNIYKELSGKRRGKNTHVTLALVWLPGEYPGLSNRLPEQTRFVWLMVPSFYGAVGCTLWLFPINRKASTRFGY